MKVSLFILALFFTFLSYSQSTIGNIDFEDGNFNNWTTINGTVNVPAGHGARPFSFISFGILDSGIYNQASHIIIDTLQYDPNVPRIKTLCPYTNSNSIRLGDFNGGHEAPRIEKLIAIDSTTSNLDFFFALVMNDPSHPIHEQPYLFVELYDSSGGALTLVDSIFVIGGSPILTSDTGGWGNWKYIDWTHQKFNLNPYSGKNVLLRITNADCGYGGHGGTAYFDFVTNSKINSTLVNICPGDSMLFKGNYYNQTGLYFDTSYLGNSIDSIHALNLKVVTRGSHIARVSSSSSMFCKSDSIQVFCDVYTSDYDSIKYNWFNNNVLTSKSGSSPYFMFSNDSNYISSEVIMYKNGCEFYYNSDTVLLRSYPISSVNIVILSGSKIKAKVISSNSIYSIKWYVNGTQLPQTDSVLTLLYNGNIVVTVIDVNNCMVSDTLFGYVSGLNELDNEKFNFYPNPATNSIYLQLNGEQGTIEIMDTQGKIVQSNRVKSDGELNLENIEKGAYLIRFTSNADKVIIKKLLVE